MLKLGTNNIDKIYLGNTKIAKAYLGDTLVYESVPAPHDYSKDYLTFEALETGSFKLYRKSGSSSSTGYYDGITSIHYSKNNGNWTSWSANTSVSVVSGDKIKVKAIASGWGGDNSSAANIVPYCNFKVYGNIMSVIFGDDFIGKTSLASTTSYKSLNGFFWYYGSCGSTSNSTYKTFTARLKDVENLVLPATTLQNGCYSRMFNSCSSITTIPKMALTTSLKAQCYQEMFYGCTSLTTAPILPATTLASECYRYMFYGCTSLTTAPELPATTLANNCYQYMFQGCARLNYIKAMFTTTPSSSYTGSWVQGVAATGTFVKNSAATWTTTGVNGVPSGWTVQTASV